MRKRIKIMSMWGAGIHYRAKKYITHTTLPFQLSALRTFSWSQRFFIMVLFLVIIGGFIFNPLFTAQLLVGIISIFYFVDAVFNLILTLRSLNKPNEIVVSSAQLQELDDAGLPVYTILCPLYKETHVIPQFIEAIAALSYPKDKLDVILLLEEDDIESIATVEQMHLPYYFRTIVVPDSLPKTKPKACNYGLAFAKGEYLVIYDAEDIPDPLQLKKAYLAFQKVPQYIACLQAKLNYYNVRQNILTRIFTAEYSLWFDITLPGLQSFNSTIPLGGTSNHFKTDVLRNLEGWDPFNVTEDADLGIRLFKKGFKTAIIDSTTYEEATSKVTNWIRQRSRWIKGYMQTYLVHMRNWKVFVREYGFVHAFIFQLTVGGKLLFLLLNPFLWFITLGYFGAYSLFGPTIEVVYQPPIFYLAVFSWIFGNFLFLYYYMLGCAKRNQWDLLKYIYLVPFYWACMSYAAVISLYQLLVKPYYWEKTVHGFHLLQKAPQIRPATPAFAGQATVSKVLIVSKPAEEPAVAPAFDPLQNNQKRLVPVKMRLSELLKIRFTDTLSSLSIPKVRIAINKNPMDFIPSTSSVITWARDIPFARFQMPGMLKISSYSLVQILFISFLLSFDFAVAAAVLSPYEERVYFLLSLTAKTVLIIAQGFAYLTNDFLSRNKKVIDKFYDRLFVVFLAQWIVFIVLGFEGQFTLPALFGDTYSLLVPYTSNFLFAGLCFAISFVFSSYHAKRKRYAFFAISITLISFLFPLLYFINGGLADMVTILSYLGVVNLAMTVILHTNKEIAWSFENNMMSLFALFENKFDKKMSSPTKLRIILFNWRDIHHEFSGGAEVYIHELAKRWVKDGNTVTLFCGNDRKNSLNERIDGIHVIRRGGTYTVYLFALLYYFLKHRGKYDVIVDCENGIPFFMPFFVRIPVVLLIHHVHQEVFRDFLPVPWKQIASFLEGKVMPYVYRNTSVITVSESSKKEIIKLGFTKEDMIEVIYNGVSKSFITSTPKTSFPSFVYLGRLKAYKNIEIAIKAFAVFVKEYPDARLSIVGNGEYGGVLKQLVSKLGISQQVIFYGRVTEEQKTTLLAQSWAMLQPSQVEGWGITVIEANRAGTPVIASRVNGLKDSVIDGKTGILVKVRDSNEFVIAMKKIATAKNYRTTLSRNAFLWSMQFDWDKSASDFYTVIVKTFANAGYQKLFRKVSFAVSDE